jgi:hypothetical protein
VLKLPPLRHSHSALVAIEEPSYNLPQEPPQRMLMPMDLVSSIQKVFGLPIPGSRLHRQQRQIRSSIRWWGSWAGLVGWRT